LSYYFYIFIGLVGLLFLVLFWSVRKPRGTKEIPPHGKIPDEFGRQHATHLPQIRQALAMEDFEYVEHKGSSNLLKRFRKERHRIAKDYLAALREDFQSLLELARIITVLSPEVAAMREFERLKLAVEFNWRYELIRMQTWLGFIPLPQLNGLADVVSGLSARLERAVRELGERAALTSDLALALRRSGIDSV